MEEHELPERLRGLGLKKYVPGEKIVVILSETTINLLAPICIPIIEAEEREKGA